MPEYMIRIKSILDPVLAGWFEDCKLIVHDDETRVFCILEDQAALFGMLQRIQSLGLPLVEAVIKDEENEK